MDKSFTRITESDSNYDHIENFSTTEILQNINAEDKKVAYAVEKVIPTIQALVDSVVGKLSNGGRLFYIGAGTSGRLGLVDASECPPTFGVPNDLVIGVIAGGHQAMFQAVENAEDNMEQAWKDLMDFNISSQDVVVGIAASGTTPYVIGGLETCRQHQITTGSISCNLNSPVSAHADFPIEVVVGPEFITGSTRMKSGTAQKMVLNMISTAVMVKLGRIKGNKMVNMQLTNQKLFDRGVKMIMDELKTVDATTAAALLSEHGSVKKSIEAYQSK
ncbi:MAG: N-acetylmuramic acid 6-phosphate etherase [Sediminibacterium sp.]|jgi:N-acetylmuramic acid 6-phosphate etherase|nr:N-acetylmuramic acid 6-phosphate etherase [Sediminibacterium sp.]